MGAYYRATLDAFIADDKERVLGRITSNVSHNELQRRQIKAWEREIGILQRAAAAVVARRAEAASWSILLEYPIPRRRRRLDAVFLAHDLVVCLEFKTEGTKHTLQSQRQVEDYALDLRDFHELSTGRTLIPIVVVPKAEAVPEQELAASLDPVRRVRMANRDDLPDKLLEAFQAEQAHGPPIDAAAWDRSAYRPVPTIIEAAETLFRGHNVREIAHSHAGATNLTKTTDALIQIIQAAQQKHEKVICFVTGVPGAGKTLAGLSLAHNPALRQKGRPAGVFLSGNGPLVKILTAAIARDQRGQLEGDENRTVTTFVQNVHVFVREHLDKRDAAPVERTIIFDEAQRAWDLKQNQLKNGTEASEPETVLSIMHRHKGWAVVVALVGSGQEIHNGEAGLEEWGRTLREKFPRWRVVVSPEALDPNNSSNAGHRLFADGNPGALAVQTEEALHLRINLRSFRAQRVTEWVESVLRLKPQRAAELAGKLKAFPLVMTRSLATAREWLRSKTRGRRRCGLVACSGALRLRAEGIELSSGFRQGNRDMYVHWFLAEPPDVRSSNQLEAAASEFECQGLELDWVGVCWGGDLTHDTRTGWQYRCFSGSKWGNIDEKKESDRRYLLNTYRVLLTRARQGMIIWVPRGDPNDASRPVEWFESTAEYLSTCGLTTV